MILEWRIIGGNGLLLLLFLVGVTAALGALGGEMLNLSCLGFEVVYPYAAALAVGEWGKTRADENFGCIAAQSRQLFPWVIRRFAAAFLMTGAAALTGMAVTYLLRREMPFWEMLLTYFGPAFFLASLCALLGLCFRQEHIAALLCGLLWLLSMLARGILYFSGVEYVYLFIRFAGDENGVWLWNKLLLMLLGLCLWAVIYCLCKGRRLLLRS